VDYKSLFLFSILSWTSSKRQK